MSWCLSPIAVQKFKLGLKNGEIDPVKLAAMETVARRTFLGKFVGEENAKQVNSLFESKLLLKNQKAGMIAWAKKTGGMTPQAKTDLLSKIEKLDKALTTSEQSQFLGDLASSKLKIDVNEEETNNIFKLSRKVSELKAKANKEGIFPTEADRFNYGESVVNLENYVNELKLEAKKISFKEAPVTKALDVVKNIPAIMKSSVASFDNSFWGRQGIKTILDIRTSKIWTKNFLKSWLDIKNQILAKGKFYGSGDDAVMDSIKTDIYSRPNAVNGKYEAGDYGLHVFSEEAYPSSIPEKIPLFGRIFKASEVAYNGGALRLRADLADRLIKIAEKNGINVLDKREAQGLGQLVSSLTGRGPNYLKLTGEQQKGANVLLFSIKFLESNINTLIAPVKYAKNKALGTFATKGEEFAQKEAAKATLSILASLAGIFAVVGAISPDNVDIDPRSTNFGKIKIFGHWVDITGGMASLVVLAARLTPTTHNGEQGLWMKSSTGNWTKLNSGVYGKQTALDLLEGFGEGKLSPFAGGLRDYWKGTNFQGQPVTLQNMAINATVPLSIQNYNQLKDDPNSSFVFGSMLLDGVGLSTSTYQYSADWTTSTTKEMEQFKSQVGEEKFKRANDDYNRVYTDWNAKITQTSDYKNLSDAGKASLATKAKADIKAQILKEYGFKYKEPAKTQQQKDESAKIKKMVPKK